VIFMTDNGASRSGFNAGLRGAESRGSMKAAFAFHAHAVAG